MHGRGGAASLGLLLSLGVLAGCIGGGSDDPRGDGAPALLSLAFDEAIVRELFFTASDGEVVHGSVYLPKDATSGARYGTIVHLSPYFTNLYGRDTGQLLVDRTFNETNIGLFVGHGFAYVAASVPGTGQSTGCFTLGGISEQRRMAEFVQWVAGQPWSNGNVGMIGVSYDGTTPWQVAIQAPPALKTIVPMSGISDMYRYEYQDGAPYTWWGPFFLPFYLFTVGWNVNLYDPSATNPNPAAVSEDVCPNALEQVVAAEKTTATGQYDAFWSERNFTAHFSRIQASVLLEHGLQDWNVKPDHADVWAQIPGEKHLWLGQWAHNYPWRNSVHETWNRLDWNATVLAWFDHYLNGAENGIPASLPPVWVQDSFGRWREEAQWPPANGTTLPLFLAPGRLANASEDSPPTVLLTPPSYVGAYAEPTIDPSDYAPEVSIASFLSEPLTVETRISGVPSALLHLAVDRPGHSKIVVRMYNVTADGEWNWLNEGGRGLAQRNGREMDEDVPVNRVLRIPVNLHPMDAVLHAGERLAIQVTGDDPDWFHPNGNLPRISLYHDPDRPSRIDVPVLPAGHDEGLRIPAVFETNPYWALYGQGNGKAAP